MNDEAYREGASRTYDDGRWILPGRLYQCGAFSDGEPAFTYVLGDMEYDGTLEMVADFCSKARLEVPVPMLILGMN